MQTKIERRLFLGFICIHILYHAKKQPIYGSWMIEELRHHGYSMSAGTLYPILHSMEREGLLALEELNVEGKIRKYYSITPPGATVLAEARAKAYELFREIKE
ncbi:MAG: PadR family transcriptional regulator [Bacillota bacterium]|nr:MAG: PadR family transcriptional regulator [Bacillota bacterium]MBS3950893.1 helix-turn-helix transcriptional regulator [Peptococcaceae bacterium]